jgi:hypothetical protein
MLSNDENEAIWERFYQSEYFQQLIKEAKEDIEAGRTIPMEEFFKQIDKEEND